MSTLNRKDLDQLERRSLQLTVLAAVFVLGQAAGLAVLMYPLVFVRGEDGNRWTLRVAYCGFCVLTLLFVGYLLDRQHVVSKLKHDLLKELEMNVQLRQQASVDILQSMPGQNHFWDRLVMEHRRAMTMKTTLSLLLVQSKRRGSGGSAEHNTAAAGDAAKAMSRKLRRTDSMYNLSPDLFAVVLPESDTLTARRVSVRLQEELQVVTAQHGVTFDISVQNYPEHVKSSLEDIVKSLLLDTQKWEVPVTAEKSLA
jgi:GGDEF domain-containing protein